MKYFLSFVFSVTLSVLCAQNEIVSSNLSKEKIRQNKVTSIQVTALQLSGNAYVQTITNSAFDKFGNIISDKRIYSNSGQLMRQYYCDSCRIYYWDYMYTGNLKIAEYGFNRDKILMNSIVYEYNSLGKVSKYISFRRQYEGTTTSAINGKSFYEKIRYTDIYDTTIIRYVGDTIKYYVSGNSEPAVHIERLNRDGFLVEYVELEQGLETVKNVYEYDSKGNRTAEKCYDFSGELFAKTIYAYDERGLLIAKTSYQGNMTTPTLICTYVYELTQ